MIKAFTYIAAVAISMPLSAYAEWRTDFDGQVALSQDGSIAFTCPPPGVTFIGPTFEVFTDQTLRSNDNPRVVFIFDDNERFVWSSDFGAEMYAGPVENPYDTTNTNAHGLRLSFGTSRVEISWYIDLAERFMQHSEVQVTVDGVSLPIVSLDRSAKALASVGYLLPPC